jgi:hypothetical protein
VKTVLALYCTLPWWGLLIVRLTSSSLIPSWPQTLTAYGAALVVLSPMMIGFGVLIGYIMRRDFYKDPK